MGNVKTASMYGIRTGPDSFELWGSLEEAQQAYDEDPTEGDLVRYEQIVVVLKQRKRR